jgi:hypothetical protein
VIEVIAVGDLHAEFAKLWRLLRRAGAADEGFLPTPRILEGNLRVVLLGDLVHPKRLEGYQNLTGLESYDPLDPQHLKLAARAQIRELSRLRRYVEAAPGRVVVLMGNHDYALLDGEMILGNQTLEHREFHPELGGLALPEEIRAWIETFPYELTLYGVNFAHVGPAPWLQSYDALFYASREAKEWWQRNPDYVQRMGYRFGIYGHTPLGSIVINENLALIDAFDRGEYLTLRLSEETLDLEPCSL